MASFDTVSEVNMQELDNAVNNLKKELNTRFDFKGSNGFSYYQNSETTK